MKSNINHTPLRTWTSIAHYWKTGNIYKFTTPGYPHLPNESHYADGWRDLVIPPLGEHQRHGDLIYDEVNDVVTRQKIDFTAEEIEANRRSIIPQEIRPSQGKIQLYRMGLLEPVNQVIESSEDVELRLFWEYALTWELSNSYIQSMANLLGMSQDDVEQFFMDANEIK